jgi:glutamate dehydrogenase (NADP+)
MYRQVILAWVKGKLVICSASIKRLTAEFTGVLTGKGLAYGGSKVRMQATGYGLLYFVQEMLKQKDDSIEGKTVVISGSGNVAQFACEKAIDLGANVVTLSDSGGYIFDKDGIDEEKFEYICELKNEKRGRIKEYAEKYDCEFREGKPWEVDCDIALPCATQNEIEKEDAESLTATMMLLCVAEGANMPCTDEAVKVFHETGILYGPGKRRTPVVWQFQGLK